MCEPTSIAMAVTAVSGAYSAYNQYQQGVAEDKYYQYLANQSEQQGQLALKLGDKQSQLIQDSAKEQGIEQAQKKAKTLSTQRATMAAMGMDPSSVTAQDITTSSIEEADFDEMAIRYNADVKSWETETQAKYQNWFQQNTAQQQRYAGKYAKWAGGTQAVGTLLSTATSVFGLGALSGSSGSTQGITGWLSGYKNAPKGTTNMGNWTLLASR